MVITSGTKDPFKEGYNRSISIGLLISPLLNSKVNFLSDETIISKEVGVTCERCPIKNYEVRFCDATELEKQAENKAIENMVKQIQQDFS